MSEEDLAIHRLLNLTTSMLSVMEPDGRVTWVNDAVLEYLGISRADLGSNDELRARIAHPDDLQKVQQDRQKAFAEGVPYESEQRLRRKDGQYRWFLVRYRPLQDATGRVVRWYGGASDIDDRVRVEEALRRSEHDLEVRVAERTRIARELHDTLLQSFHGLLLQFQTVWELLPTRPAEAREILGRTIDRAANAIGEGRDAVQGLRTSAEETCDLVATIEALGEELAGDLATNQAASLRVSVEGAVRCLHPTVRDEIYRISAEAMRNAFQHSQGTQIELELRYDEQLFRLRVCDNGAGIDGMVLAEEGREGHYGLRGMRERAELIGGSLNVSSGLDAGTEVEFTLAGSSAYANAGATFGEQEEQTQTAR